MQRAAWLLAVPLVLICGCAKTHHPTPQNVAQDAGALDGHVGDAGLPCDLAGIGRRPAVRFADGDSVCMMQGKPPFAYSTNVLTALSAGCVYRLDACENCVDWCCPAPFHAGSFDAGTGPSPGPAIAYPDCERVAADDAACTAQSKPAHGYHCTRADDAGFYGPPGAGCIGNPYPILTDCSSLTGAVCCP
jgi:hypothetical protein